MQSFYTKYQVHVNGHDIDSETNHAKVILVQRHHAVDWT